MNPIKKIFELLEYDFSDAGKFAKLGPLFAWGEALFGDGRRELHLIGPNQENLPLPDWVHYHGPASPEALARDWFPRATGLLTLSRHAEGRPQVLLEAMAAGLPIIASDIDAHRDLLAATQAGRLVSNAEDTERALLQLEQSDANAACSQVAKAAAQTAFGTWADCAGRYLELYRAVGA